MAEHAPLPLPDEDAASVKIDYDFLNQIAQMFELPAVSGAPVNQIARFLGFFVCFVCVLVSSQRCDVGSTESESFADFGTLPASHTPDPNRTRRTSTMSG